jgi:hypothetical protein
MDPLAPTHHEVVKQSRIQLIPARQVVQRRTTEQRDIDIPVQQYEEDIVVEPKFDNCRLSASTLVASSVLMLKVY